MRVSNSRFAALAALCVVTMGSAIPASAQHYAPSTNAWHSQVGLDGDGSTVFSLSLFPMAHYRQSALEFADPSETFEDFGPLWAADAVFPLDAGFLKSIGVGASQWSEAQPRRFAPDDHSYKRGEAHIVLGFEGGWGLQASFYKEEWPGESFHDRAVLVSKTFVLTEKEDGAPEFAVQLAAGPYFTDNGSYDETNEVTVAYYVNFTADAGGGWSVIGAFAFAQQNYRLPGELYQYNNRTLAFGVGKRF